MAMMNFESFKTKYEKVKIKEVLPEVVKSPLVSVCIQTYNHEPYIAECLEGILQQKTDFDYEILIGEDDSEDRTREICLQYAQQYPEKIKLFLHHRENNIAIGGSPTGRFIFGYNLYSAKGNYVSLCEGDDFWTDPDKLQKQVDFLENHDEYIACFTNGLVVNEIDNYKRKYRSYNRSDFVIEDIIESGAFFPTASLVFRNVIKDFPEFFFEVKSGDRALALILARKGKFHLIDQEMVVYRRHAGGIFSSIVDDSQKRKEIDLDNIYLLRKFDTYTAGVHKRKIKKAISRRTLKFFQKGSEGLKTNNFPLYRQLVFQDWLRLIRNFLVKTS